MSKVISFSISDRYLDKLRSLYPTLTDNLAAKQFITGGLESSLSSSLDDSLDDGLDDKLKSLVESELDGILDERLDAVVGKLLTSLSDRLSRLEERLDTNLDGRLDDMERLLKLQRESSIASPLPPIGEPSPLPPSPDEPVRPAIEDSEKKIIPLPDTLIVSPIETVESGSESISSINEPDTDAIETLPTVETVEPISTIETVASAIECESEGMTSAEAHRFLISKNVKIAPRTLDNWVKDSKIPKSRQGEEAQEYIYIKDKKYYAIE